MSSEQTGIVDPLILENPADKPDRLEPNEGGETAPSSRVELGVDDLCYCMLRGSLDGKPTLQQPYLGAQSGASDDREARERSRATGLSSTDGEEDPLAACARGDLSHNFGEGPSSSFQVAK